MKYLKVDQFYSTYSWIGRREREIRIVFIFVFELYIALYIIHHKNMELSRIRSLRWRNEIAETEHILCTLHAFTITKKCVKLTLVEKIQLKTFS